MSALRSVRGLAARWMIVAAAAAPASAQPEPASRAEPPGDPAPRDVTADDVAGAPVAGRESGRTDEPEGDSAVRQGLRGLLLLPRVATEVVLSPVRLFVWAYDRYHLDELYNRVFFNDARTIGVIPSASFESGFGVTLGARFVHRDLFGAREQLSLGASVGGRYQQLYQLSLHSGDRLGDRVAVELDGQYELRPRDVFYGIGDHSDTGMPAAPVDPRTSPVAVDARFRQRIARLAAVVDARVIGRLHLRSSSEIADRMFSVSRSNLGTAVPIDAAYDPMGLVGFDGVRHVYSELEARYDSRGRGSVLELRPFYSVGSLAAVFGGRVHRLDSGADYWRYGIDLQHFLRVADGPRVLAFRLRGEAVSGTLDEVPFVELPRLGGADDLRGYPGDRFRDRVLALGSVEYDWDLSTLLSASLFVDTGRVFGSLSEVEPRHLRTGFGVALTGYTPNSFGVRASIASSVDGGVQFNLSFNPVFTLDERVRRR